MVRLGTSDVFVKERYIIPLKCLAAGWSYGEIALYCNIREATLVQRFKELHPTFKGVRRCNLQQLLLETGLTPIADSPPLVRRQGLIYTLSFSYCDALVKIGKTTLQRFNSRLGVYKTSHCQQACSGRLLSIELVDDNSVEQYEYFLHSTFQLYSCENSEWYFNRGPVASYISQCSPDTLFEVHQTLCIPHQRFFQPCLF